MINTEQLILDHTKVCPRQTADSSVSSECKACKTCASPLVEECKPEDGQPCCEWNCRRETLP